MTDKPFQHAPDAPWIFRTYAGHSTAEKSNALYRRNLLAGQTREMNATLEALAASADHREAVASFLEKRPPVFRRS